MTEKQGGSPPSRPFRVGVDPTPRPARIRSASRLDGPGPRSGDIRAINRRFAQPMEIRHACPPLRWAGVLATVLAASAMAQHQNDPYGDISDLKVAKPEDKEDVESAPPPPGAIVLFDGNDLDDWVEPDGKTPAPWKLADGGAMQVKGGGIMTKQDVRRPLQAARRVPRPLHARSQRPGPGQQRRLPPGPLRGPGPRQLRPRQQGQRLRRHLQGRQAAGQRLQGPDRLAELRHRLPRPGLPGRQEGRSPPGSPSSRTASRSTTTSRSRSTTPSPASAATRARPARSCSRTTATRSSSATSGSFPWTEPERESPPDQTRKADQEPSTSRKQSARIASHVPADPLGCRRKRRSPIAWI